jgi:hypothetical protein
LQGLPLNDETLQAQMCRLDKMNRKRLKGVRKGGEVEI